uniref:Putative secreted protein n=1 Tax=Ixodes ricinus TaxID=34613 RepID=A0A6B0UG31_IXORI
MTRTAACASEMMLRWERGCCFPLPALVCSSCVSSFSCTSLKRSTWSKMERSSDRMSLDSGSSRALVISAERKSSWALTTSSRSCAWSTRVSSSAQAHSITSKTM